jgi:hypothetical protein
VCVARACTASGLLDVCGCSPCGVFGQWREALGCHNTLGKFRVSHPLRHNKTVDGRARLSWNSDSGIATLLTWSLAWCGDGIEKVFSIFFVHNLQTPNVVKSLGSDFESLCHWRTPHILFPCLCVLCWVAICCRFCLSPAPISM